METETLSNYNQTPDRRGLRDNIPNDDDNSNSLHSNDSNDASLDISAGSPAGYSKTINNVEDCDETIARSKNRINSSENLEIDCNKESEVKNRIIDNPAISSINYEKEKQKVGTSVNDNEKEKKLVNANDIDTSGSNSESSENSDEKDSVNKSENGVTVDGGDVACNTTTNEMEGISNKTEDTENTISNGEISDSKKKINKQSENLNDTADEEQCETKSDIGQKCPLLKETLTKQKHDDSQENKNVEEENGTDYIDMDDDFDPSLLCPDIAMEVDEAPVITTTDIVPSDGSKSPPLYEPVYSTYVDEMTGAEINFNLTPEEQQLRITSYGDKNPIQLTRIHCTACNVHLGSALDGQGNRFVHPLLKVLICKDCYNFYTSGEFAKDEDGSELYCRWCGQGGNVMCCSNCEMVFCEKCIRINFGRRKVNEIIKNDWACFRCNTSQLKYLRIHCAEFMEYVRREISRAATLENASSFMTTDYTQCCNASRKKKSLDPDSKESKRKKRKHHDPDYEPELCTSPVDNRNSPVDFITGAKLVPILPKPLDSSYNAGTVTQVPHTVQSGVFKVGNTTFKPNQVMKCGTLERPVLQIGQLPVTSTVVRPQGSTPGYIKIMPGGIRAATISRPRAPTFVSSSARPTFRSRLPNPCAIMKHEWFEKTVRAAARVNSNLSYTLTQLNRAQSTASSVEALAVVHNKLQEILSTSINSLIQIRKNLRTEFIAGIKTIRFQPKQVQSLVKPTLPSTSNQDDDVIFVSPSTSPLPQSVSTFNTVPSSINLANTFEVSKQNVISLVPTTSFQTVPSTSTGSSDKPKTFLRVKSLSALQSVPAECITIPDEPIEPPPLEPIRKAQDPLELGSKQDSLVVDNKEDTCVMSEGKKGEENIEKSEEANIEIQDNDTICESNCGSGDSENTSGINFIQKDVPSDKFKCMLNLKVNLMRSEEIDRMVRKKFGLVNGDISE